MKSQVEVTGGSWLWFGDQPVKYGVPMWVVVIYVRAKRLMGLVKNVKIKWLNICLLPLLKLHSVNNFVIYKDLFSVFSTDFKNKSVENY